MASAKPKGEDEMYDSVHGGGQDKSSSPPEKKLKLDSGSDVEKIKDDESHGGEEGEEMDFEEESGSFGDESHGGEKGKGVEIDETTNVDKIIPEEPYKGDEYGSPGDESQVDKGGSGDESCEFPDKEDYDENENENEIEEPDTSKFLMKPFEEWTDEEYKVWTKRLRKRTKNQQCIYLRILRRTKGYEVPAFKNRLPAMSSFSPLPYDEVHGKERYVFTNFSKEAIDKYNKAKGTRLRFKYLIKATTNMYDYYITVALIDDASSETYVGRFSVRYFEPMPPFTVRKMSVTRGMYQVPTWKDHVCHINEEYRVELPGLEKRWLDSEKQRAK